MATSIQFNIRSLLAAMVLTAVVLAAGMPVVRSWGTPTQLYFLINAAASAALLGLSTIRRCVVRRRVERLAGEVLLRGRTQGSCLARTLQIGLLLLFVAGSFLAGAAGAHLAASISQSTNSMAILFSLALAINVPTASYLVTNCWWRVGFGISELAENGIIEWGTLFTPYERLKTARWNRCFPDTLMLFSGYGFTIVVPPEKRERIAQFLNEKGLMSSREANSKPGDHGQ